MQLERLYSGKVRDIYDAGNDLLLMVASDRISAYDHVFAEPIPNKGRVLTAMTAFWAEALAPVGRTHLVAVDPADFPAGAQDDPSIVGRAMLVRRAEMLPIECIVRGYITGSAWSEYLHSGTMHGQVLPAGLKESDRLPEPVFTPSTKATEGHDENISIEQARELVGAKLADEAAELSLAAYHAGAKLALERGIVIADTKFELGLIDGELVIADEILTPDSSRFWSVETWAPGATPPSLDKQPLRDWASATGWDKNSDPPAIPDDVVEVTSKRYVAAYEALTGRSFADWWGVGAS